MSRSEMRNGKPDSAPRPRAGHSPREAGHPEIRVPAIHDLAKRLRFAPQQGRIWLDDQRMMLMHISSLGALRQELIESLGKETARGLITRIGYQAGTHDAAMARKVRAGFNTYDDFLAGPQLVSLEGIVHCEPIALDIDVGRGHYFGDFYLIDSSEAEAHIASYGIGNDAVCWMLIGYACGYTSAFMGRPILWREIECRGMGHAKCRVIGKPVEEWDDPQDDLRFLQIGDFVKWSLEPQTMLPATSRIAERIARAPENSFGVVGISAGFNTVCHMVNKVAPTEATVLFLGESGVGKEVFANNLHRLSKRADKPFVAVNCASIPEHLMESELFGVERGGYTGATSSRPGRFERADGGTLFLDEIGTLSYTAQGKLLRALQQGELERVGDTRTRKIDVRVIAATNVNLREAVKAGQFREDLFFRLNVFPILVPPLRERRDDIPLMMNWFLQRLAKKHDKQITGFRERAVDAMFNYDWPGNVRELENMIERAVILAEDGGALDLCHLFTTGEEIDVSSFILKRSGNIALMDEPVETPSAPASTGPGARPGLAETEVAMLRAAIAEANGNLSLAARVLGISRPTLAYRLRKYGIAAE
ncbi:sigma-54-dependent Fis family transcriptional regulator [Burkholderia contaminans]|uniref:sigma-54-dependent Fis family transcriptional regulator n=1 Tax=Burkholderia contaminans TaxID=488447 RepID=UPI000A417784|nr:sigma-54-dependent Fis family transcriptional regulator [Burkholderia contaminans]MEB4631557.1 sigma-54-dependent Fis family transcriptional regulator [Burkholderia contaminans]MEB4637142.1 sigma-54-dependent Fis family transcriptional regulator [Burkholderia contaminans]MEB4652226.1 sigma-54-dependent Fis family transcriptional regulator [Burkholderia contaminans]MEB4660663.1 sigma-54-dependent Fis family transcriptional regulator [Burkholderia contaminans]MEB4667957.1 sigma-54-dependent F